jgi:GDPmannose 4,6-dehydratase
MSTALITGILGQDGSLLAELLLARGYRVVGIEQPGVEPRGVVAEKCELIALDLATQFDAEALIAKIQPDEVYHLAACHHSSESKDDPALQQRMTSVNTDAALALARAVVARGRGSLVCACSSQMYTPALGAPPIDEQTPHAPATFYGVTKASSRDGVRSLREQGLHGSCAILFNHESPRRSPVFASRKITRAAAQIAAGHERTLALGDLYARVDFSAASDVVAALTVMAAASEPGDRVIASGVLHTLDDVCRVAFAAVGLDHREHVTSATPPGDRPALVGDPRRIERDGWRREKSFSAWIEEMVEADVQISRKSFEQRK